MATYTKTYTSAYGGLTLEAVCTYTDNVASNNSTVSVTLNLKHGEFYASALSGSYLSVAGVKKTYSKSISWSGGATTTQLATQTATVSHNADGTGSCRIIGTFVLNGSYGSTSIGTMTIDQTLTLTKIPRASTVSVPTSAYTGGTLTATITPANSSFKHKLQYKIGSTVFFTSEYLPSTTTSYAKTIPHSWLATSQNNTLVVLLTTYTSDGTAIGSNYKLVSLSVPETVVPTISAFTATSSVTSGTFAGLHVQGKTSVVLSVTAQAVDSTNTPIVSYIYSGPNMSETKTETNIFTTPVLNMSVTQSPQTATYTVKVIDARGRSATKTVSISVWPYSAPSISSVSVQRCDSSGNLSESGTYAKYTINSSYSSVNSKNTRTITAVYSSDNGVTYLPATPTVVQTAAETANTKTGVYGSGVLATTNAYLIKFVIKDAYGASYPFTASLQSAKRPINIRSNGKGVAIGAMSTKDEFEVSMNADFNNNVNIDGTATIGGATTTSGTLTALGPVNVKNNIYMGGSNGQTGELAIMFSNPTSSTYPHKSYLYGGNPNGSTAIGMYDGLYERTILQYIDGINRIIIGNSNADIYFNGDRIADYVIENGTSGEWTIRKWRSGIAECWRKFSGNITKYTTWNGMHGYTGSAQFPSGFFTQTPNVQYQVDIGNGFTMPAQGASSTKDQFNWLALASDGATNVGYSIDVYAVGKWK
jgi:hypothetical protein